MGYLSPSTRDPRLIRDAAAAALADRLEPNPAARADDARR